MGRPRIPVEEETLDQIKELAAIRCTQDEAARVLGVSRRTFARWMRTKRIRDLWQQGEALGKVSLRRAQFETAQSGNAVMQIWLGKIWLGQFDPAENKRSQEDDERTVKVFFYPSETSTKEAWLAAYGHLGNQAAPPVEITDNAHDGCGEEERSCN